MDLVALDTFLLFLLVGFAGQLVDGALGMAYGVVCSTVLLSFGVPPATASASVHAAEVFTTGASAASHVAHRNVDWQLFFPLAVAGMIGGVAGAYVLTGIDGDQIKPWMIGWLGLMGVYILWRAWRNARPRRVPGYWGAPLGLAGGFADAVGGGGWGPTVASTMMGAGLEPRKAVGTVNTAEFFVTCAITAGFVYAVVTGRWEEGQDLYEHGAAVGGLVVGGLVAAPFAGLIAKKVPRRVLMVAVGLLVVGLAGWQLAELQGLHPATLVRDWLSR